MSKPEFKPGDLLTKGECQQLFEEILGIKRTSYYENYRPHIKFKHYGSKIDEDGNEKKTIPRIPYEIALGCIHLLLDRYDERVDPPIKEIEKFMKNVPEGMFN